MRTLTRPTLTPSEPRTTWQPRYDDAGTGVEIEETTDPYILALAAAALKHPVNHPEVQQAMEAVRRHSR